MLQNRTFLRLRRSLDRAQNLECLFGHHVFNVSQKIFFYFSPGYVTCYFCSACFNKMEIFNKNTTHIALEYNVIIKRKYFLLKSINGEQISIINKKTFREVGRGNLELNYWDWYFSEFYYKPGQAWYQNRKMLKEVLRIKKLFRLSS